jgi:BMFP domain-containing protein YqiC
MRPARSEKPFLIPQVFPVHIPRIFYAGYCLFKPGHGTDSPHKPKDFGDNMTQAREKILDDMARLAGGTAGFVGGLKRQIKGDLKSRVDEMAQRMDLVPREDFERLESMLVKAREEQEALAKRITALEEELKKSKK